MESNQLRSTNSHKFHFKFKIQNNMKYIIAKLKNKLFYFNYLYIYNLLFNK